ncbi:MAG: phosphonate monoester hydrolase [Rhodobacteraceae bacterium]|nr:MAG: phosphonate monoester hydrolase [Paracoccaceae bacterium]
MDAGEGNVLFVTLDQLRADAVTGRLAGLAPTPALDRLRAEGATFLNHHTVTVPCGPSRASLLTGLYAFNHRAIRNGTPLAAHHDGLGKALRRLGREPLLFGYTDSTPDPTRLDPNDPDLTIYEGVAPGWRELCEMRADAGFEWPAALKRRGYAIPEPTPDRIHDLYAPRDGRIDGPALYSAEDSDTAYLTDRALEALDVRRWRPWFAHLAYIRPHPPLVAPEPFNRLVDPARVPPPAGPGADHPFRAAWFSEPTQKKLFHGFDGDCAGMAPETAQALRAVYLGLLAEVDRHLGRLLDWLDETGQADRTLVIVTADHGEMLGDQGMWGKESVFLPAHHVPLIVRDPRRPGARAVEAITETVDLAPTVLDWLGAAPPPAMDGASLLPFLDGSEPPGWRDAALTEIDLASPATPTRFQRAWGLGETRCNAAVIRDARWTYVHFNGGVAPMLFDRAEDPEERRDLAGAAGAADEFRRLAAAMLDRRMTRADRRLTGFSFGV